jgi:hypothetical protein
MTLTVNGLTGVMALTRVCSLWKALPFKRAGIQFEGILGYQVITIIRL